MNKYLLVLLGLITLSGLIGCPSSQPTQPQNPSPTNTPTVTSTPSVTPTATTCSIYGTHDSSTTVFSTLNQWDVVANEFTITKATTVTGFNFYFKGIPNPISVTASLYTMGPSTGIFDGPSIGLGGVNSSTEWASNLPLPSVSIPIYPGTYAVVFQNNGPNTFWLGVGSSNCTSLSFNSNSYDISSGSAPWYWLNGNGTYPAATQGVTCFELCVTTCP